MNGLQQKELLLKEVFKALSDAGIPVLMTVMLDKNEPRILMGDGHQASEEESGRVLMTMFVGFVCSMADMLDDNPDRFMKNLTKEVKKFRKSNYKGIKNMEKMK